ncbi:MAG: hypothetical protein AABX45_01535 [Nanoarchaeota archaeon]
MKINKKGAELSINVIIIAILFILVLVIVAAFFTGGSSKLFKAVRDIFTGTTAGTDRALAEQNCQLYCSQSATLQNPSRSAYCTKFFNIDADGDGESDYTMEGDTKVYKKYYCGSGNSNGPDNLGVPCADKQGQQIIC